MSNSIKLAVTKILSDLNVDFNSIYIAEVRESNSKTTMDEYKVIFKNRVTKEQVLFDYRMGLGHRKFNRPSAPHASDVLYSLFLDISDIDLSFENWCSEFGYDSDSISALKIYNLCKDNAVKLKTIFNENALSELRVALEDY